MRFFKQLLLSVTMIMGLGIAAGTATAEPAAKAGDQTVLTQMFVWWNEAIQDPNALTREAFGRYFTEDGAIMINGKVSAKGLDDLVKHFRAIQQREGVVEILLPFEEEFVSASGDRIFTYHFIKWHNAERRRLTHAMGHADIRDGKIALIHLIRAEETDPEVISAHW